MKSLGRQVERTLEPIEVPEKIFPSFYVDNKQMPEIDSWEIGKEYTIEVKVKMTSYESYENEHRNGASANLDMISYQIKKKDAKSLT